eukprot:c4231_g1_i1.p1 GENE.c4231_g1_i1~~c4231_g1_i1.p1  ORF type:complete len:594 (-),score=111.51 c4231_g1_i1:235-2016(-)
MLANERCDYNHTRNESPHFLSHFSWQSCSVELWHFCVFLALFSFCFLLSFVTLLRRIPNNHNQHKKRKLTESYLEEAHPPIVLLLLVVVILSSSQIVYFAFGGISHDFFGAQKRHLQNLSLGGAHVLIGLGESLCLAVFLLLLTIILKLEFAVALTETEATNKANVFFFQASVISFCHVCFEATSNAFLFSKPRVIVYRVLHLFWCLCFFLRFVYLLQAFPPVVIQPNKDNNISSSFSSVSFYSRLSKVFSRVRRFAIVLAFFFELAVLVITASLLRDCVESNTNRPYFAHAVTWAYPFVQAGLVFCTSVAFIPLPSLTRAQLAACFCLFSRPNTEKLVIKTTPPSHSVSTASIAPRKPKSPPTFNQLAPPDSPSMTRKESVISPLTSEETNRNNDTHTKKITAKPILLFPTPIVMTNYKVDSRATDTPHTATTIASNTVNDNTSSVDDSVTSSTTAAHPNSQLHNPNSMRRSNSLSFPKQATFGPIPNDIPRRSIPNNAIQPPSLLFSPVQDLSRPAGQQTPSTHPSLTASLTPTMSRSSTRKSSASLGGWLMERQESLKRKAKSFQKKEVVGVADPAATTVDDINPVVYVV